MPQLNEVYLTITVAAENINDLSSELTFSHSLEETAVQNFVIPITDDMMVESNEQIRVYLNVSHNGVVIEPESEVATINILNDDGKNNCKATVYSYMYLVCLKVCYNLWYVSNGNYN